jgi:hypothetical protein
MSMTGSKMGFVWNDTELRSATHFRNQTDGVMTRYDLEGTSEQNVDNDHGLLSHGNRTHLLAEARQGHNPESLRSAFDHERYSELGETWATKGQGRRNLGYLTVVVHWASTDHRATIINGLTFVRCPAIYNWLPRTRAWTAMVTSMARCLVSISCSEGPYDASTTTRPRR